MTSRYATAAAQLVQDVHRELIQSLDLPTPFRSTDPELGERYGRLAMQSFGDSPENPATAHHLNCIFLASAGFKNSWESAQWAIGMTLNLDDLILKIDRSVDKRGLLSRVERVGNIACGNPRAPLKMPEAQRSHVWIVDVLCQLRLVVLFSSDPTCGHQ